MTVDEAVSSAARLLQQAELEITNLQLMEQLGDLADRWIEIGRLLNEREVV
ncbi:hypothetical protein ACQPYK_25450 [Streptosporangium sp. CA-135522]|uniref:hypothetical protein n=1 Tax=Streptosporangium sp. CA-135522 TaxID=3240072 RepID=UPI003D8E5D71